MQNPREHTIQWCQVPDLGRKAQNLGTAVLTPAGGSAGQVPWIRSMKRHLLYNAQIGWGLTVVSFRHNKNVQLHTQNNKGDPKHRYCIQASHKDHWNSQSWSRSTRSKECYQRTFLKR